MVRYHLKYVQANLIAFTLQFVIFAASKYLKYSL
jgi:hypothetical protein